jgi:serine/threonine protein kinase
LFLTGKILHRDISENNIIITDPKRADGFTGMLIDLDLGKQVGSGKTGARHMTGTMEFMAIEVLQNVAHTYRHDLESFFYVLLWKFGRRVWEREFLCNKEDRPTPDLFQDWYRGTYFEIARTKLGDMGVDRFKDLLAQFPAAFDCVKHLCCQIRGILFPLTSEGGLNIRTPPTAEDLYNRIIKEYDDAIPGIRARGL